jgi:Alpha-L-arabinofuranosidase
MKKVVFCSIALSLLISPIKASSSKEEVVIHLNQKGAAVSPSMYGVFFEEISHAGDGGLYAELVKNRSFEELEMPDGYTAKGDRLIPRQVHNHITGKVENQTFEWTMEPVPGWKLNAETKVASMKLTKENPKFATAPNNVKISITDGSKPVSIVNEGYWGMGIAAGARYDLRTIIRPSADYKGKVLVKIVSKTGAVLASSELKGLTANKWNDLKTVLMAQSKDSQASLTLEFKGKGTIWLDYVSLFPESTFRNRTNGFRPDVANMLVGLKPGFMRWPGGCVVEGVTAGNRFEWKKTLGDPAARSGEYSTWGYRCSYGFGYYEYLQLCEDLGAKAMFVSSVGLGCQFRMADATPQEEIQQHLQDCLDAIEYALGDGKTTWGAKRVAAGHPKPFPLKYVEIGNENWGPEYEKRFDIFYAAIKAKYPQLTLISNHDMSGTGKIAKTDMVDPHWYVAPEFFYRNAKVFDSQPRGKFTVYVGEYACNNNVGAGNMTAALSEAAFITGMERNSDLVKMASYAPLFENNNKRNWSVNLIWLNSNQVMGRSSYYVQKMFSDNRPTYNVTSNIVEGKAIPEAIKPGSIGFGSWATQVEFKEIKVRQGNKITNLNASDFTGGKGEWKTTDGVLSQTSEQAPTRSICKKINENDYTLEFKARKTGGKEGFFVYFCLADQSKSGFAFNIAGWNNSATAVERIADGNNVGAAGERVNQTLETNKWYDVKIVVTPSGATLYMDGKLITAYVNKTEPRQFFASGYDEATGEVVLKVVNASNAPYAVNFNLEGSKNVKSTGKVITLKADSGNDENSFDNPKKIYPTESMTDSFGKNFDYTFAPNSLTVLRVKADKQ